MDPITLWWLSLAIFLAVVVVVAILLGLIIATAKSIDDRAAGIWQEGKQIASNTVAIWVVGKSSEQLALIREALRELEESVRSIDEKVALLGERGERR